MPETLTQDPTNVAERSERCSPVTKIASLSLGLFTCASGELASEGVNCALHYSTACKEIVVESGGAIAQPVVI
jgi:hypothetical protein